MQCAIILRSRGQFQINNNLKFLEDITAKPKLRTYCKIKHSFQTEPYIAKCFSRNKRSILAQLRIGILPIMIDTGRYSNITPEHRLCNYCSLDKIYRVDQKSWRVEFKLLFPKKWSEAYKNVIPPFLLVWKKMFLSKSYLQFKMHSPVMETFGSS